MRAVVEPCEPMGPGQWRPFTGPSLLDHLLPRGCPHVRVLGGLLALPHAVLQPEDCPCCVSVPSHWAPWTGDFPSLGGEVGSPWGEGDAHKFGGCRIGVLSPTKTF